MHIAIFHGNERWILRGLAIAIDTALNTVGASVSRHEVDLNNQGKYHKQIGSFSFNVIIILRAWGIEKI